MIKELHLKSFGRFFDQHFELSTSTIFLGMNEAGKTTLVDALLQNLCDPPQTSKLGRQIKSRYGNRNQTSILFSDSALSSFDEQDVLGICVVRAGDLSSVTLENESWLDSIQSRILTGGINLPSILFELERTSTTHKNSKLNKIIEELESKLGHISAAIKEMKARHDAMERALQEVKTLEMEKRQFESDLKEAQTTLALLQDKKIQIDRSNKLDILNHLLDQISQLVTLNKSIEKEHSILNSINSDQLIALDHELQEKRDTLLKLQSMVDAKLNHLSETKILLEKTELTKSENEVLFQNAEASLLSLADFSSNIPSLDRTVWNKPVLLMGIVTSILLTGLPFLISISYVVTLGLSAFILVISFVLARSRIKIQDPEAIHRFFGALESRFNQLLFNKKHSEIQVPMQHELVSWTEFLSQLKTVYVQDSNAVIQCREQIVREEISLSELKTKLSLVTGEIRNLDSKINSELEPLRHLGLIRVSDLKPRIHQHQILKEKCKDLGGSILKQLGTFLGSTFTQIKLPTQLDFEPLVRIQSELFALRDKLSSENRMQHLPSEEIRKQYREIDGSISEAHTKMSQLQNQIRSCSEKRESKAGEIRGTYQSLSHELQNLLHQQDEIKTELTKRKDEQSAALLSHQILIRVQTSHHQSLSEVLHRISNSLSKLLGITTTSEALLSFDKTFQLVDREGTRRTFEHLSTGTKDLLALGIRLGLLEENRKTKSHRIPHCIILDEPFATMDTKRTLRALELLSDFNQRFQVQVIGFTKDPKLAKDWQAILPNTQVHNLDQSDQKPISPNHQPSLPILA